MIAFSSTFDKEGTGGSSKKYRELIVKIVTPSWILACGEQWTWLNETSFLHCDNTSCKTKAN